MSRPIVRLPRPPAHPRQELAACLLTARVALPAPWHFRQLLSYAGGGFDDNVLFGSSPC